MCRSAVYHRFCCKFSELQQVQSRLTIHRQYFDLVGEEAEKIAYMPASLARLLPSNRIRPPRNSTTLATKTVDHLIPSTTGIHLLQVGALGLESRPYFDVFCFPYTCLTKQTREVCLYSLLSSVPFRIMSATLHVQ